jgi:hypothetical protein
VVTAPVSSLPPPHERGKGKTTAMHKNGKSEQKREVLSTGNEDYPDGKMA